MLDTEIEYQILERGKFVIYEDDSVVYEEREFGFPVYRFEIDGLIYFFDPKYDDNFPKGKLTLRKLHEMLMDWCCNFRLFVASREPVLKERIPTEITQCNKLWSRNPIIPIDDGVATNEHFFKIGEQYYCRHGVSDVIYEIDGNFIFAFSRQMFCAISKKFTSLEGDNIHFVNGILHDIPDDLKDPKVLLPYTRYFYIFEPYDDRLRLHAVELKKDDIDVYSRVSRLYSSER